MPRFLVTGSVQGRLAELFETVKTTNRKIDGGIQAVLCVGDFLNEDEIPTVSHPSPIPIYFIAGGNIVSDSAVRMLVKQNAFFLGRGGLREIAGIRVAYLSGLYDTQCFERGSDGYYSRDDIETLLIDAGAYVAGGGIDILLTTEPGTGYAENESDEMRSASPPIGYLLAELPLQYHFVSARGELGLSLEPYRVGRGAQRIARVHALPSYGAPKCVRAFEVKPFDAHFDIDTEEGARQAALWAEGLRRARPNPYATRRSVVHHKPPPGLSASPVLKVDRPPAVEKPSRFPATFVARGQRRRQAVTIVEGGLDHASPVSVREEEDNAADAVRRSHQREIPGSPSAGGDVDNSSTARGHPFKRHRWRVRQSPDV